MAKATPTGPSVAGGSDGRRWRPRPRQPKARWRRLQGEIQESRANRGERLGLGMAKEKKLSRGRRSGDVCSERRWCVGRLDDVCLVGQRRRNRGGRRTGEAGGRVTRESRERRALGERGVRRNDMIELI